MPKTIILILKLWFHIIPYEFLWDKFGVIVVIVSVHI